MRAAPAARLGVAPSLRRAPAPSRVHGAAATRVAEPRHLAAQADGATRAAEPVLTTKPKRAPTPKRPPRDLPALENALQAAADAEAALPPTRTEEELFAEVQMVRGTHGPVKQRRTARRGALRAANARKRTGPLALAALRRSPARAAL